MLQQSCEGLFETMSDEPKSQRAGKKNGDPGSKQNQELSALDPPTPGRWQILYWPAHNNEGKILAGAGMCVELQITLGWPT